MNSIRQINDQKKTHILFSIISIVWNSNKLYETTEAERKKEIPVMSLSWESLEQGRDAVNREMIMKWNDTLIDHEMNRIRFKGFRLVGGQWQFSFCWFRRVTWRSWKHESEAYVNSCLQCQWNHSLMAKTADTCT